MLTNKLRRHAVLVNDPRVASLQQLAVVPCLNPNAGKPRRLSLQNRGNEQGKTMAISNVMTADQALGLANELELAVVHLGRAIEALKAHAHAQGVLTGQVEAGTLEAPAIIDGKINGRLRLNGDERAWSS